MRSRIENISRIWWWCIRRNQPWNSWEWWSLWFWFVPVWPMLEIIEIGRWQEVDVVLPVTGKYIRKFLSQLCNWCFRSVLLNISLPLHFLQRFTFHFCIHYHHYVHIPCNFLTSKDLTLLFVFLSFTFDLVKPFTFENENKVYFYLIYFVGSYIFQSVCF